MNATKRFPYPLACCLVFTLPCGAMAAWPPSICTHIKVLNSHDTDEVSFRFDGGVLSGDARLEDPGPNQLDVLGEALDMLPEITCQAIRKVAFVYRPPEKGKKTVVDAWTTRNDRQNLVYLNTWDYVFWNEDIVNRKPSFRAAAIQRMIHETTHAAIRLIQSQQKAEPLRKFQDRADETLWPASSRQLAKAIIARNRLETGVIREWQRVHDSFVAAGMAEAYYGDDWPEKKGNSAEYLSRAGFMSAYGGEQANEDIAEMASWAIVRGAAEEPEDGACQVMNSRSDPGVQSVDAAVYTKLGFIRTLGLISERAYESCVGKLKIDAPGPGFYSYKSDKLSRSYTAGLQAGAARGQDEDEEWLFFEVSGDGTVATSSQQQVPVTITLSLNVTPPVGSLTDPGKRAERLAIPVEDVGFPRGVYLVGFRNSKYNRLQIARKEDGGLIMDVGQGVALIGRANTDFIEGSVVVQRIFNFSGGLLSSIAGDEPVGEPTRITFRYRPHND